jgi:hypothetical protein
MKERLPAKHANTGLIAFMHREREREREIITGCFGLSESSSVTAVEYVATLDSRRIDIQRLTFVICS